MIILVITTVTPIYNTKRRTSLIISLIGIKPYRAPILIAVRSPSPLVVSKIFLASVVKIAEI